MEKNWGDTPSATLTNQLTTPKSFFFKKRWKKLILTIFFYRIIHWYVQKLNYKKMIVID